MTDASDPVTAVFDLQRAALEGSRRAFKGGIETQKRAARMVADGLGARRRTGSEAAAALRAFESVADATEVLVDSSFDAAIEANERIEAQVTGAAETTEGPIEIEITEGDRE